MIPFALYEAAFGAIEDILAAELIRQRAVDGQPRVSLESVIDELGFDLKSFELS